MLSNASVGHVDDDAFGPRCQPSASTGYAVFAEWHRYRKEISMMILPVIALLFAFAIGFSGIAAAFNEGEDKRFRYTPPLFMGASVMLGLFAGMLIGASCDTHPKDGDVQQAPLVSGAVPKADAQPQGGTK
jgi:hypothetical protein